MDSRAHPASLQSASATQTGEAATHSAAADSNPSTLKDTDAQTNGQAVETDAIDSNVSEAAPTYGTRSRNRSGNARPDYTEKDENLDDLVPTSSKSRGVPAATDAKRTAPDTASTRQNNGVESPAGGKETISSTSATSTNPPKKRKAAGTATTSTTTTAPPAYIPAANSSRETNMMTFEKSKAVLKKGALVADDGTVLMVDDHVYLVCEPPGDPYYLCRIMEFLHVDSEDPKSPVDSIRVNWFYRPRDVQRHNSDTRLVYGTMHSDICPLPSLRGKCRISHRSEISNLDEYRKGKDCFWYSQIFDRFIRRFYELIPTSDIINVPDRVKKALDERWKYIAVEIGRVKELTSAVKLCKRCSQFCASSDSVDCAICKNAYHMNCVRPPLPKKPTRGFAWACGPCGRAQEKRLEARQTPLIGQSASVTEEEEILEEEEEDPAQVPSTRAPSPDSEIVTDHHPGTQAEIAMAKMWPFRYLGIHCRVEDALQYDDRAIYPRASSRLGPRHQANVNIWHGRPIELVKPAEIKKRYVKSNSHKKDGKLSKETLAAIEADRVEKAKRPKWVQDEPPGYVHRGEDYPADDPRCSAKLLFKMPDENDRSDADQGLSAASNESLIDEYMKRVAELAPAVGVAPFATNFLDKAVEFLKEDNYDSEKALQRLAKVHRGKDLKEPILSADQLKRFEEGVAKYGSEHRLVRLHMKTDLPNSTIVRFYYIWKKTPRGKQIWDHFGGRKGKKQRQNMDAAAKLQADVAHDVDDSAYDTNKAEALKRGFQCKMCSTRHSRQWRRAPGVTAGQTVPADPKNSKDKGRFMLALCGRCAGLWRRYAIHYEDLDEATRKAALNGGKGLKRRIDEELLREVLAAHETPLAGTPEAANVAVPSIESSNEPPRKKTKTAAEKKEKPPPQPKLPTPPPPPIVPDQPRWRDLPCAVCRVLNVSGELPVSCHHCKLTVHKRCYGLADQLLPPKWVCDQCTNDRNPTVSTDYACTLCTLEETVQDLLEPPKVSHKKKTDREREKERLEKELIENARLEYQNRQKELNRPLLPREPLKKTDGNNWVHVLCAAWTPEIRFSQASALEKAEGFSAIPMERYEATCKLCKSNKHGSCVSCQQCKANFHVGCAANAGYTFGFDVTPVKGSRKDQVTTVSLGDETGALTAAIWCREHTVKTIVHPVSEAHDDSGKTALQLYVEAYKQADRTLTGTARKANLLCQSTKLSTNAAAATAGANRRVSMASTVARGGRNSSVYEAESPSNDRPTEGDDRRCVACNIDVSPRWWPIEGTRQVNGDADTIMGGTHDSTPRVNGERIKQENINGEWHTARTNSHLQEEEGPTYRCHKCHLRMQHELTRPVETIRVHAPSSQVENGGPLSNDGRATSHGPAAPLAPSAPALLPATYQQSNGYPAPALAPPSNIVQDENNGVNGARYGQGSVHSHPVPALFTGGQYGASNGQTVNQHYPMSMSNATAPPQRPMVNGGMAPQYGYGPSGVYGAGSNTPYTQPFGGRPGERVQHPESAGPLPPQQAPSAASPAPPPAPALVNGQHSSPAPTLARPATPRDEMSDGRLGMTNLTGASASPSLRNLLH